MKTCLLPLLAVLLALTGCDFEAPLTATPTRKLEPKLLGEWIAVPKDADKPEPMGVHAWDASNYAVGLGTDVYRAYHSDFAGLPLLSVQDLNSDQPTWCLFTWALSADGNTLTLRRVETKVVPEGTKTGAELQKLIQANLAHPKLLGEELKFTRKVKKIF